MSGGWTELIGKTKKSRRSMTIWLGKFRRYWQSAMDYVFPRECFGCGREGEWLCSACFDSVKFFQTAPCFLCNRESFFGGACPECQTATGIDEIIVATTYEKSVAGKIVEQYKYNFLESAGEILVRLLVKQICQQGAAMRFAGATLMPIPLHPRRLAERGYNQAAAIAAGLAQRFGCQVDENLLKRIKYTRQQAKLDRAERRQNIKEAFAVNCSGLMPETVVLVDDVLTTGATFAEAACVLKSAGVKRVVCVAVCHG